MAVGGGAAYQRLQVPKDDISANARHAASLAAANMRHQRGLNAQKKKDDAAAKAADEKDKDAFTKTTETDPEKFKTKVSGFDNIDDVNRDYATKAFDRSVQYGRLADEAYRSGDKAAAKKYKELQSKIENSFSNSLNSTEAFKKVHDDFNKDFMNGDISMMDEDFESFMEAGENADFERDFDEHGNPTMRAYVTSESDQMSYIRDVKESDVIKGKYAPIRKVHVTGDKGLVNEFLENQGVRTFDSASNNYIVTKSEWDDKNEKAAQVQIEGAMSSDRKKADLLFQATGGKVKKYGNMEFRGGGDHNQFTEEDNETIRTFLYDQIRGGFDESQGKKYTGAATKAQKKTTPKTKKEEELGVRAWNIDQTMKNDDVSFFETGDFEWNGKEHEAVSAEVVGDRIVINTRKGKQISVKKSELGLNDLHNAFEGKTTKFDDVQTVEKVAWRDERVGSPIEISQAVKEQYSPEGKFIGDDDDFAKSLKSIYPEAKISTPWVMSEAIEVNGIRIDLSISESETNRQIKEALGLSKGEASQNKKKSSSTYKAKTNTKGR